jgi:hypothetical protein
MRLSIHRFATGQPIARVFGVPPAVQQGEVISRNWERIKDSCNELRILVARVFEPRQNPGLN